MNGPVVRLFKDSDSGPSLVLRKSDRSTLKLDCRGPKGDTVVGNVDLPAWL